MGTRHTIQAKHQWLQGHFRAAKEKGVALSYKSLLAHFCIDNMCEERTGRAILKLYLDAGKVKLSGDELIIF